MTQNNREKLSQYIKGHLSVTDICEETGMPRYVFYTAINTINPDITKLRRNTKVGELNIIMEQLSQAIPYEFVQFDDSKVFKNVENFRGISDNYQKIQIRNTLTKHDFDLKDIKMVNIDSCFTWFKKYLVKQDLLDGKLTGYKIAKKLGIYTNEVYYIKKVIANNGKYLVKNISSKQEEAFQQNMKIYEEYIEGQSTKTLSQIYDIEEWIINIVISVFKELERMLILEYIERDNNKEAFLDGVLTANDISQLFKLDKKRVTDILLHLTEQQVEVDVEQTDDVLQEVKNVLISQLRYSIPVEKLDINSRLLFGTGVGFKKKSIKEKRTLIRNLLIKLNYDTADFSLVTQQEVEDMYKQVNAYNELKLGKMKPFRIVGLYQITNKRKYELMGQIKDNQHHIFSEIPAIQEERFFGNVELYLSYKLGVSTDDLLKKYDISKDIFEQLIEIYHELDVKLVNAYLSKKSPETLEEYIDGSFDDDSLSNELNVDFKTLGTVLNMIDPDIKNVRGKQIAKRKKETEALILQISRAIPFEKLVFDPLVVLGCHTRYHNWNKYKQKDVLKELCKEHGYDFMIMNTVKLNAWLKRYLLKQDHNLGKLAMNEMVQRYNVNIEIAREVMVNDGEPLLEPLTPYQEKHMHEGLDILNAYIEGTPVEEISYIYNIEDWLTNLTIDCFHDTEYNRIESSLLKNKASMVKEYRNGEITKETMIKKHQFNPAILEKVLDNID
ncbi:hypothetical protein [Mammaliicoccus sciuri]|uniref:hypothetical protein n=1 Tax=Mammaliicoccus sciuri TaxID=1296 RepID=UPI0028991B6D|nr:hypothetical protein [Mammaliicoccus sciuri]